MLFVLVVLWAGINLSIEVIMKLSKDAITMLKYWEGLPGGRPALLKYNDSAGIPTIGFGHVIKPNEEYTSITDGTAEAILLKDLSPTERMVNTKVTVHMNQNEYDALVIFAFNTDCIGATMLELLNKEDYKGCAEEFKRWNKITVNGKKVVCQGLNNRRTAEYRLFTLGEYNVPL